MLEVVFANTGDGIPGSSTFSVSTTSYASSWELGDVFVGVGFVGEGSGTSGLTGPSGWTELFHRQLSGGALDSFYVAWQGAWFWQPATAGDVSASPSWGNPSSAGSARAGLFVLRGADFANPIGDWAESDTAIAGSAPYNIPAPSVDPIAADSMLLTAHRVYGGGGGITFTDPSGMTREAVSVGHLLLCSESVSATTGVKTAVASNGGYHFGGISVVVSPGAALSGWMVGHRRIPIIV